MISLRYHVVSLSAVFLALAVGVVFGSTSGTDQVLPSAGGAPDGLRAQTDHLRAERDALDARVVGADRFAAATGPRAVRGELDQRSVVLVAAPDAQQQDVDGVRQLLGAAGANLTGEVRLTGAFVDPNRADQLRDIVTRLVPAGVQLPTVSNPGTLAGALLSAVTLTNPQSNQPQATPEEQAAAFGGLIDGGFVTTQPGAGQQVANQRVEPAQLAVVVAGGSPVGRGDPANVLAGLATEFNRSGTQAVLAGRVGSADGSGPVAAVRADRSPALSTVDDVDTAAGRVATVLALREQLDHHTGHFGIAGNAHDGPAPAP